MSASSLLFYEAVEKSVKQMNGNVLAVCADAFCERRWQFAQRLPEVGTNQDEVLTEAPGGIDGAELEDRLMRLESGLRRMSGGALTLALLAVASLVRRLASECGTSLPGASCCATKTSRRVPNSACGRASRPCGSTMRRSRRA